MATFIQHMKRIVLPLIISCFSLAACATPRDSSGHEAKVREEGLKERMLQYVNKARAKGCQCGDTYFPPAPALQWNDKLESAAQQHSNEMNARKYFSHTSKDGSKAGDRITRAGYAWKTYGENIGMGFATEKEMVDGWLKSPGHCRNIMNRSYTEMGAGKAGQYWTQTFGAR